MKKVIVITYYWNLSIGVGKLRWMELVKSLKYKNINPIVYTVGDNNEEKVFDDYTIVTRKIFDINSLFSKVFKTNYSTGVVDSSESTLVKIFSWFRVNLLYPDPRIFWSKSSVKFLTKYMKKNNIQTVITTAPPHSMHTIGYRLKKILKINWIADFRDPYVNWDILLNMKPTFISSKIHTYYQNLFLNNADKIVVTNTSLYDEFSKIVSTNKLRVITNGSNIKPLKTSNNKRFILSYFGLINKFRDPINFLNALEEMVSEDKVFKSKLELNFYGNIQKSTIDYLKNNKTLCGLFNYYPNIDHSKINKIIPKSSLLLLLLNNEKNQNTTPYKLFDYLVSERPIITLGDFENKHVDTLLRTYNRYNTISYTDIESIKSTVKKCFSQFLEGKLDNISFDYSKLRYDNISKEYKEVIFS